MKFWIPHPGHTSGLEALLSGIDDLGRVEAVYTGGSPDEVGTGRPNLHYPRLDEVREQVELAHSHDVLYDVVINSTCPLRGEPTRRVAERYSNYLEELEKAGVDGVVVADPFVLKLAAEVFDRITVSCLAFVNTPEKAEFYADVATAITVDTSFNRRFEVLEELSRLQVELKVIVNEGCLLDCPYRPFHFNIFSHLYGPDEVSVYDDYYYRRCIADRLEHPELIIKSPWIRPEDLGHYLEYVDAFKISGRSHQVEWIVEVVNAYLEGRWDGNLLHILDCPRELRDVFYVPNPELDGAIERWKECDFRCHECGFCRELADRVVEVREFKSTVVGEVSA
ncbi:peptidase U32 family protein [Methanopyrus kandleri]|uniref:Predicted protease of the collagenase family n=2 Tax=Methanopyrus kandleri TaxID=2320 RepID=Q8TWX7_METKA|nr:peptidase U32 family protein [Methanopyrus kandleri]AAM02117.1 Predicted protease of the collagenase family [Methanopyrus kandleri AV19]HII69868.1 U32 family peptidase [Methanopyrus kandleri]